MFEYHIQQMQNVSNNQIAQLWMKVGMVIYDIHARALVNEAEKEEMEFRDRFVGVTK